MTPRARIREAIIASVADLGYEQTTVEMVVERAGVSRAEFDSHFDGKEDCCLKVYLENIETFDRVVFTAYAEHDNWREALRAAAYAAARYLRDRPEESSFNVAQILEVGEIPKAYRDTYMQRLVDIVDGGRQELDDPDSVPRSAAEGVVGSVFELALKVIRQAGDASSAEGFVPGLMYIAVLPYLGADAAQEELSIPPPPEAEDAG